MAKDIKKATKFIEGVAKLGKELGISPGDALVLFGSLARGFIEHTNEKGDSGMSYEELVENAMTRFASGLGGAVKEVRIEAAPGPREVH